MWIHKTWHGMVFLGSPPVTGFSQRGLLLGIFCVQAIAEITFFASCLVRSLQATRRRRGRGWRRNHSCQLASTPLHFMFPNGPPTDLEIRVSEAGSRASPVWGQSVHKVCTKPRSSPGTLPKSLLQSACDPGLSPEETPPKGLSAALAAGDTEAERVTRAAKTCTQRRSCVWESHGRKMTMKIRSSWTSRSCRDVPFRRRWERGRRRRRP